MKAAISVRNLSKKYRIGTRQRGGRTLREAVSGWAAAPWRRVRTWACGAAGPEEAEGQETIWALRDINCDIQSGEVVGLLGRNGAGKSTLLKILSRIAEPTGGRAEVRGRIRSLLEVGTGFHPELTGRENVYLNGAVLGMSRQEIARKFDAIVAFSEVEKFLDTPVKRYSSGMYVRLAFAVAAHLEPEILLVDEVLAVGDLAFQQKCLLHMSGLTHKGMTVVLVSHVMSSIQSCCTRALFLEDGVVAAEGKPAAVIERYRRAMQGNKAPAEGASASREGVSIVGFEMFGEDGKPTRDIRFGEEVRIRIDLRAERRVERPMINFGIKRGDGVIICNFNNWYDNAPVDYIEGPCTMEGWLPPLRLTPDYYEIHALVWPWGGGHLEGDMRGSMPLAAETFGSFHVSGPPLNAHDGVFQIPARKWRFQRGPQVQEICVPPDLSLMHMG
jgi:lipopolysaccharide transport system ATP-binding protein